MENNLLDIKKLLASEIEHHRKVLEKKEAEIKVIDDAIRIQESYGTKRAIKTVEQIVNNNNGKVSQLQMMRDAIEQLQVPFTKFILKDKIDALFPNNKMNMNYLTIVLSRDKDSLNLEVVKKHTGTTPAVYKLKSRLASLPNGVRI